MSDVALRLLVLQFLVAAVFWVGSAPLDHFRWKRGPQWARVELTRGVLPLLMVSAGLLFFSAPLAPMWQSALYLDGFQGIPANISRWAFLTLNLGVLGVVLTATGGAARSPFVTLLVALPVFIWAVGAPAPEVIGAGILALIVFIGVPRPLALKTPQPVGSVDEEELAQRRSRWTTLLASVLTLAAALWMGGRLPV